MTKVVVEASLSRGNAIGTAGMIDDSLVSFDLITVIHRKVTGDFVGRVDLGRHWSGFIALGETPARLGGNTVRPQMGSPAPVPTGPVRSGVLAHVRPA